MKVCGARKSCGFILKQEFRLYEHRKSLQRRHVTQKHSTLSILLNKIQEKCERLLKLNTRLESTQPDLLVGEVGCGQRCALLHQMLQENDTPSICCVRKRA